MFAQKTLANSHSSIAGVKTSYGITSANSSRADSEPDVQDKWMRVFHCKPLKM